MTNDFLAVQAELMRRLGVAEKTIETFQVELCRTVGGERPYVPKSPGEVKKKLIGNAIANGMTLTEAFASVGISRAQGYRIIKKQWRI